MPRDTITGLDADVVSTAYTPDPPPRTDPVTPFLDDAHDEGIFKQPQALGQDYPTRDPEPA